MARGLQARWGTTGRCHGAQRSAVRHMRAVAGAAAVNPGTVLPTPHSGYHWDGLPRRFFEGWYFKACCSAELDVARGCVMALHVPPPPPPLPILTSK
jgi:hypothetical protein